jgi:2'-5' RNA ligase
VVPDAAGPIQARPLRLFVAVDVPGDVRSRLAAATGPWRDRVPGARWTRPEGWHVTLKFLGWTAPGVLQDVRDAVERTAARTERFDTALTATGAFPSPRRARVLWVGLDDPDGRFGRMVKTLDELLREWFEPEARAFTPHLTLARIEPAQGLTDDTEGLVGRTVGSARFAVDRLVLYRSRLSPRGATYEALARAPLHHRPRQGRSADARTEGLR